MMTKKQTCIRFQHPCGARNSSQWRQALLPKGLAAFDSIVFHQSATALSLIARTEEASAALQAQAVEIMRAVANVAARMLDVEMLDWTPALARTGYRWHYRIPKLVVARSGGEWDGWRMGSLDDTLRAKLMSRLESDLRDQAQEWTGQTHDWGLELVSDGRPMVITGAVSNGPKPVAAMARLDVVFSSDVRIEGSFWTGLLQATGHGRIFRDGYQEKE